MSTEFHFSDDRLLLIAIYGGLKNIRREILDNQLRVHPEDPIAVDLDPFYNFLKITGIKVEDKTEMHAFMHHLKKS